MDIGKLLCCIIDSLYLFAQNPISMITTKTLIKLFSTFYSHKMFFIASVLPAFILLSQIVDGQSIEPFEGYPPYGIFTPQDTVLKQVDFDKDANAVVIHDLGRSEYNESYNVITTVHRVKIKILNDRGIDNANITIRYYSKDDFEFLSGIDAVIENHYSDGQITTEKLNRKDIFNIKVNPFYSETRFTLPNVRAGSIIEYTYSSNIKYYSGLTDWSFQSYLPTISSFYKLAIVPNTEFTYKVHKLQSFPMEVGRKPGGRVNFKMENIPALHDEAYMDSRIDNLQRITFLLSPFSKISLKEKYKDSWDALAEELLYQPAIGGQLRQSLSGTEDFIRVTKAIPDVIERVKATYQFVQQRMSSNGYISKYSEDGIKKAWKKGTGTSGEINLVFVNLLSNVDVPACLMLTNERFRGKIDINYPFIDQFSNIVAYIKLPEKPLIIDASDTKTPINLVPFNLLNTYGCKLDRNAPALITIENDKLWHDNRIKIIGTINLESELKGTVVTESYDYAKLQRTSDYNKIGIATFKEKYFSQSNTNLQTDSLVLTNVNDDSLPLKQQLKFTQPLNTSGKYMFLNHHLFTGLSKNPFTNDFRFSNINFGSPQRFIVTQKIQIPDKYVVEALPQNIDLTTPDSAFLLSRHISVEPGTLDTQLIFTINKSFFKKEDYKNLQTFYKQMFGLLDEQVVLKQKN